MDKSASEITFNENGVCNFCISAQQALKEIGLEKPNFYKTIERIKQDGKGKKYDCLIGLSGGVDSSMVLHNAVKLGLRPFTFTLDNGWNDPKADENVLNLVETLKVPLYRYVVDLLKFRKLQATFMNAGIKNLEAITDHILFAVTYELANKYDIKWVLSGGNVATESIMPASWGEDPRDLYWIKSIYKLKQKEKLIGLPMIPLWKEQYFRLIKQIKFLRLLDYLDYNRNESIKILGEKYGYKSYGEKHCENYFTWWFQNFYLFEKWNIDKRKAHLASLINSGQVTRHEALELLAESPEYPKLGIEKRILEMPNKTYDDYPNSKKIRQLVVKLYKYIPKNWKS